MINLTCKFNFADVRAHDHVIDLVATVLARVPALAIAARAAVAVRVHAHAIVVAGLLFRLCLVFALP